MPDLELETAILEALRISNKAMRPCDMAEIMLRKFPDKWRGISKVQTARCRVAKTLRTLHEDGKITKVESIDRFTRYRM